MEESIGLHIFLSNIFWWSSFVLALIAYRYRHIWNIGNTPWTFLILTFFFFGIRELGHFTKSPFIGSIRYIFGIWAAIFMTAALFSIYMVICQRRKIPKIIDYGPYVLASIFPLIWLYLYLAIPVNLKNIMSNIESLVWIFGSSITIYTSFMLGTSTSGKFIKVFMFFQFSAYTALIWKFLGLLELTGYPIPYNIREILETLFGVLAIISMFILTRMLRNISRLYGEEKAEHKNWEY